MLPFVRLVAATVALVPSLAAQTAKPTQPKAGQPAAEPAQTAEMQTFSAWLKEYGHGGFRLVKDGKTDETVLADLEAKMTAIAKCNTLAAAKMLFEAASVEPKPAGATSSTELIDFYRELQPWRVQAIAAKCLRSMTGDGILPWLLQMLSGKGLRAVAKTPEQQNAMAVLRVLGGHPSVEAQLELMKAARSMPPDLRVQAVNSMAKGALPDLLPTFFEMLSDGEPNVRIAAANAIGATLQPHVDETLGKQPTGDTLALRDQAMGKLEALLSRDAIWQVRNAAATAMAIQKCKAAIPALIRGLEAELLRKKDPWAMDIRLHRLLEGLTGQKVVPGSVEPWKAFWAAEGPTFAVKRVSKPGEAPPASSEASNTSKYEKFFNLEIESDRVLFVLDFSGSMAEPVKLKVRTTAVAAGVETTKAELVIAEMKKLIMSLPDGALVNLVVFSDEVRTWRQEGNRPALVRLDDEARDDLLGNFLDSLRPNGPTNLYDALNTALDFGGRGLHDKYYAAGFDTLYVITDGAPTAGAIVDKEEIRRRVRETNQLRRVTINCITFGDQNDTAFLGPLAEENGGRHIHVD